MAVLEQAADNRLDGEHECDRRRQGQKQSELDPAVLRVHRFLVAFPAQLPRDGRQQDGAKADADQSERKLVQPVGVIDVRDRARVEQPAGKAVDTARLT